MFDYFTILYFNINYRLFIFISFCHCVILLLCNLPKHCCESFALLVGNQDFEKKVHTFTEIYILFDTNVHFSGIFQFKEKQVTCCFLSVHILTMVIKACVTQRTCCEFICS